MRAPYSARCNFFADGSTADNRINWYIVPDDTPRYAGPTVFYPRVDIPEDKASTVFEDEGAGRNVRRFKPRPIFIAPPPHDVHGDDDDFQGLSLKEKYFPDGVAPDAPCPIIRVDQGGCEFGGRLAFPALELTAGVELGGALLSGPAAAPLTAGVFFGAMSLPFSPPLTAGLALGCVVISISAGATETAGIEFNATLAPAADDFTGGLELAATIAATIGEESAGLELGGSVEGEEALSMAGGLALGGSLVEP